MANQRYVNVGLESVYGTAVAGSKSFEDTGDDWVPVTSPVEIPETTRSGQQADLTHNYQQVVKGATGSLNVGLYDNGLGLLFANLLGYASAPAAVSGTTNGRYTRQYRTTGEGSDASFTVRRGRIVRAGTWASESVEEWIYAGCRPTDFELSVSKDNPWMLKVGFDARTEERGGAAVAQTYHSVAQQFFNWTDTKIQINDTDIDEFEGFSLSGNFNLFTDKHPLTGSANKMNPKAMGKASYEGSLTGGTYTADLQSVLYDNFVNGTPVKIDAVAQKRSTTASDADIFRVTLAEARFTGNAPSSPPGQSEGSMIEGPFKVFWGGGSTDYAVEITLQNGDSTDA